MKIRNDYFCSFKIFSDNKSVEQDLFFLKKPNKDLFQVYFKDLHMEKISISTHTANI